MCRIKYKNIWPLGQANNSNILSILYGVRKLPFNNKSKFSANFMGNVSRRPDVTRDYAFDPDNHRLTWTKPPESILIVKRTGRETDSAFKTVSSWLVQEKKMVVYVEAKILSSEHMQQDDEFGSVFAQLKPYHKKNDITYKSNVDLIITIGGDGTLLYAASMFQHSMPPVIALSMGSLGFLTAHPLETYKSTIDSVIAGNATLMLRGRMRCKIEKQAALISGMKSNDSFDNFGKVYDQQIIDSEEEESRTSFLVLNEVVVNRGTSQYLCNLDLYLEGRQITSVQGDGLIISTPTGSTAYAVAAGASMVHPDVPSILIAPICPHSLSFRPIIVPAGVELKFSVSKSARGSAWVSFDGSSTKEIKQGDMVSIRTSIHPTPCVCRNNPFDDWFDSLSTCLHWNSRESQKALGSGDV